MQTRAKIPGRILVIDDERSARALLERVLRGAGHHVVVVETGEAALQQLAKSPFDLLVTDQNLPGIGGLDLLRLARSQYPTLQAIMVTGFPTPESRQGAQGLGVHSYVTKPFGILEILGACDAALELARGTAPTGPTEVPQD